MRAAIADYEVLEPWVRPGRYICRAPARLDRAEAVMVSELAVDAEGWPQLCDSLVRLGSASAEGLIEVVEVGPDLETGTVFVVTEAASGGVLADQDRAAGTDGEARRRLDAVAGAARAAHALHEIGLTHAAIHPGALLLTNRGPVLDLPRLDGPPGEVTPAGSWSELAATSPELLSGEPPSRSSDIWALGSTLHQLLSSRPLFAGIADDEPVTAVQRVLFTRPDLDSELGSAIRELVEACLAADPADRPGTAREVADRLASSAVAL